MGLEEFSQDDVDYTDYDEQLADEVDERIENDNWRSNRKQRFYVVKTAEFALSKSFPPEMRERRSRAQDEVTELVSVQDKQTVQEACHTRLFKGYEEPRRNVHGELMWYELFDRVLHSIERDRRSGIQR